MEGQRNIRMESLRKHALRVEFVDEFREIVRSKVDGNTDLVIDENILNRYSDELRIYLKNSDTDKVLLEFSALKYFLNKDMAASDIPIVKVDSFVCRIFPPLIGVRAEAFRDPKEIFALLHELGHMETHERKGGALLKKIAEIESASENPDIDNLKIRIEEEKDAWASAILQARAIKKNLGINLFGLFKNADDFMGWLRVTGLRTYEEELNQISGEKSYTKDRQVQKYLDSLKELDNEVEENYAK